MAPNRCNLGPWRRVRSGTLSCNPGLDPVVVVVNLVFDVGFTEVVPTVGGRGGERELISNGYSHH